LKTNYLQRNRFRVSIWEGCI